MKISKKTTFLFGILSACLLIWIAFSGCNGGSSSSPTAPGPGTILLEQDVVVAGGGESVNVVFNLSNALDIRISMTAGSVTMEPYGYLSYPDGVTENYYPDLSTAVNGSNSVDLKLTQAGTYTLTVFDGANQGGTVHVKVEVI